MNQSLYIRLNKTIEILAYFSNQVTRYAEEINTMLTGDCTNTECVLLKYYSTFDLIFCIVVYIGV